MTTEVTIETSETWVEYISNTVHHLTTLFLGFVAPYDYLTDKRSFHIAPISIEQWIGRSFFQPYLKDNGGPLPPKYDRYQKTVEEVGQNLSPVFDYHVTNNWDFDARIFPGGKIVISLGLLNAIENDARDFGLPPLTFQDKVAVLLSHLVVHATARHYSLPMQLKMYLATALKINQLFLSRLYFSDTTHEKIDQLTNTLALLILSGIGESTSRDEILDADQYGFNLATNKQFNPDAALWIQKFFIHQRVHPSTWNWFHFLTTTTPTHQERLERLLQNCFARKNR